MKSLTVTTLVALAALFAAKPALAAEAIDVSELSCKQFTGYNDDNKGLIMMWFEGYYTEEDEPRLSISARWRSHLTQAPDRVRGQSGEQSARSGRRRDGRTQPFPSAALLGIFQAAGMI